MSERCGKELNETLMGGFLLIPKLMVLKSGLSLRVKEEPLTGVIDRRQPANSH